MTEEKTEKELLESQLKSADEKLIQVQKDLEKNRGDIDQLKSLQEKVQDIQDSVTSIEEVDGVKHTDFLKNIQTQMNNLEKDVKIKFLESGGEPQTLKGLIKQVVLSDDFQNRMKTLKTTASPMSGIMLKAAADLLTSDWTGTSPDTPGLPQMAIPGVTKHPWKINPIFSACGKRTVGKDHQVKYTEELTRTDSGALKEEGSQYGQSGATWITKPVEFYDVGHYAKVSRESLEDSEYIMQEINDLLYNGLLRVLEADFLLNGSGSSTMLGLANAAKTFAKVQGTQAVVSPTIRDIILHAKLQAKLGVNAIAGDSNADTNKTGYNANLALIGGSTSYNLSTEKDDIGRPIVENLDNWRPSGMSVLESLDLTDTDAARKFLVGDFSKAILYMKRNIVLETGLDGNDFTYGLTTIRASLRAGFVTKSLERYGFVYGDFVTAPGLIEV